ncbi:MAG: GIY-YIG catalytic domain protein [Synergistetes bacterium ADurb.BinA166]|nr:MAG: GIY-YIG catalytic domain protein [Synergistetes bacterium ADurb.BinA166]
MFTIYCHTHIESGRRYVGLTKKTWRQRWDQHVCQARRAIGSKNHWYNAIRKYGKDAFSHEVLEVCSDLEVANLAEECWIELLDTRNPEKGFNLMKGGEHVPHPIKNPWDRPEYRAKHPKNIAVCHTPEARSKSLDSLRSPESKQKRSTLAAASMADPAVQARRRVFQEDPAYKVLISETTRAALSAPEVRERLSESSRLTAARPDVREARSSAIRAAHSRPDVKERHRAACVEAQNRPETLARHRSRRASPETRAKIAVSSAGRLHTPESVERQRILYLERSSRCKFCDSAIEGKRMCIKGRVSCAGCFGLHKAGTASFLRPDGSFLDLKVLKST